VDARFAKVLSSAQAPSSESPFASALVPENLDELYAQELDAIGRASAPKTLDAPHKGLGSVDSYLSHRIVAARVTTAR
jgi:hypothetical protein